MICFCFAMEKEAAPLLEECTILEQKKSGFAEMSLCQKGKITFVALVSGIGKGFACSGLTSALLLYKIDRVVNAGVAGSLDGARAPILSCVVSSSLVQHDMDTSAIGDPKGLLSGINVVDLPADKKLGDALAKATNNVGIPCAFGKISSGDTFFKPDDPKKKEAIETFHPLVIDMESACFAQIAYVFRVPYCSLRVITDCDHPETEYAANVGEASRRVKLILEEYLKEAEA